MDQPCLLFRQTNELSEGPLWDDETHTLYWLDIVSGSVWRARLTGPDSLDASSWTAPASWSPSARIGALGLGRDGTLVGALDEGVATFAWGGPVTRIAPLPFDGAQVCFNDGKVGPDGAFWVGAKDRAHRSPLGPLVRVRPDGSTEVMETGLTISNGLDWTADRFYLTDSVPRTIVRYRWDPASGRITDREGFADGTEGPGVPDGLCLDAEGCVWTARWGGSQVVRLSPKGEVLTRIPLPVSRVSSCAFGGPDLRTLFITTAREDLNDAERRTEVWAGSVFAWRSPLPGRTSHRFG
jgi:sugar lactone lactonase YvrE